MIPLPGKLSEKICTKFLLNELHENKILTTSHAIFHFVKQIADGIDSKQSTAAVFLDLPELSTQ